MSSIVLSKLEDTSSGDTCIYKDLKLDIEENKNISNVGLYRTGNTTDIEESRDVDAVTNSIYNIFNTTPGEKLLNPTFGLSLKRYLFEPITEDTAENIGETILLGLERWEPRVRITKILVVADKDAYQYEITLNLAIPSLNISNATYTGMLSKTGFSTT
tara:strand:+ start:433 stop:909 length:477 start_codon:yes stop_codon:yes gene_type:complete